MTATVSMGMGVGKVSAFNNYPFPLLSSAPILNPFPSSRTTFSVLQAANANANSNSNADAYANSPYPHAHDFDPELRSVLELATDSELLEIEDILFGARSQLTTFMHFNSIQFNSSFKLSHSPFRISQLLQSFAQIHPILKHNPPPAFHDWSRPQPPPPIYRSSRVPFLLPCCRCPLYIKVLFLLLLSHPLTIYLTNYFLFQGLEAIL